MAICDIYSKRQKRLRGDVPDVYQYDKIDQSFCGQVAFIIQDALGIEMGFIDLESYLYKEVYEILCREYGKEIFKEECGYSTGMNNYLNSCRNIEYLLDAVELFFSRIDSTVRLEIYHKRYHTKISPDEAIEDLNQRFKEAGVGYQFESGQIIRIDSQYIHSEAVKPVLQILGSEDRFKGANEEFLSAHDHYRHGNYKEAIINAGKAFESTMKAICHKQGWEFKPHETAGALVKKCFTNKLIPDYLQNQFESLETLFVSGVPRLRNALGGHGQGVEEITVPESIANYTLNLAASNIILLAKLEKENFG